MINSVQTSKMEPNIGMPDMDLATHDSFVDGGDVNIGPGAPDSSNGHPKSIDFAPGADGSGPISAASSLMFDKSTRLDQGVDPSINSLASSEGTSSPTQMLMAAIQSIIQQLMTLLESLGLSGDTDPAEQPMSNSAASSGKGAAGAGGAGGAGAVGGGGSSSGNKGMSMDSGSLEIGEKWGGWDGVSDGAKGSSHDVEDRGSLVGMLMQEYGFSDDEAHGIAQHLHSSARESGLDAKKGVHSPAQAEQIKTQNHANIEQAFNGAPPGSSVNDVMSSINGAYH